MATELRIVEVDAAAVSTVGIFDECIRAPWLEAGVLLLRCERTAAAVTGCGLTTPAQLVQFSRFLGELDIHVAEQFLLPTQREILQITNRRNVDGSAMGFEEAGRYWHSDMSCE
jgi:alpha-ketoglutarate-dependent taurine dioxygenase